MVKGTSREAAPFSTYGDSHCFAVTFSSFDRKRRSVGRERERKRERGGEGSGEKGLAKVEVAAGEQIFLGPWRSTFGSAGGLTAATCLPDHTAVIQAVVVQLCLCTPALWKRWREDAAAEDKIPARFCQRRWLFRVAPAGFTLPPGLLTGGVAHKGDARDAFRKGRTRGACSEGLEEGTVGVGGGERRGEAGKDEGPGGRRGRRREEGRDASLRRQ